MSKRILGLDLGTTSIGFAQVIEGETPEQSQIVQIGVRVNPLTSDEQTNFEKGRPVTINADRRLKRGARRNLDRYQLRRKHLIEVLRDANIIEPDTVLAEEGKNTTHETWRLRAKAVTEKIEKNEFARVLLAINKKRGYKSSRKAKNDEEGQLIDGMAIAKRLYVEGLTPGQFVFQILSEGKKRIPDFYRSDLQAEFDQVWRKQKEFYPEIFTDEFYLDLKDKGQKATSALFWKTYGIHTADIKDIEDRLKNEFTVKLPLREKRKLQVYKWRSEGVEKELTIEQAACVITEINNNLYNSSGYLGSISDRSKALYFNKETVGQNQYRQLLKNPHTRLKNQVFYRQDYLDEFEAIWAEQSKHHIELTPDLKKEVRDIVIFYQRNLKSQKGLIRICELARKEVEVKIDGKTKTTVIGPRVVPRSSPLFQEFKIWQTLNNVRVRIKKDGFQFTEKNDLVKRKDYPNEKEYFLDLTAKQLLFEELNLKGNLSANRIIEILGYKPSQIEINFKQLEGNRTNQALFNAYLKILEVEGYDEALLKLSDKDEINVADLKTPAQEIKNMVKSVFEHLGIDSKILEFDAEREKGSFEQQKSFQLWHLLYATEDDNRPYSEEDIFIYGSENIGLKKLLCQKFGFKPEHAKILAKVGFETDYGNLSTRAIREIFPHIKENDYSTACEIAGYRHSASSLTKEEIEVRPLKPKLEPLKKNSLRNPVVEKILNQMINVVNSLLEKNRQIDPDFRFDEIRIELARELKKNAEERAEMTANINKAKLEHEKIVKTLKNEFGLKNPTRNDIIKYKLYEELKNNCYKDLYTDTYIPRSILFSKEIDVDHIIPQAKLFDDSFSNKTLTYRQTNLEKGERTAFDYIVSKFGEVGLKEYLSRVESLYEHGRKSSEEGINKAKYLKLQKKESDIGDGFIKRDLRDSQYIARQAKKILYDITRTVVSTTGSITGRLREDWGLVNIMKEINLPKYRALGMTEMEERKFGQQVEVIKDWSKRDDHRHHAMDALVIAFTKHNHIQYLNYLNARKNEKHELHSNIIAIETKETKLKIGDKGEKKRVFKLPIPNFREQARQHLQSVLVSYKTKNKIVTRNKNSIKSKKGEINKIELTPRGQLHKETIYGKYRYYENKEVKVDGKLEKPTINCISKPQFKMLLLDRLEKHNNDSKKAFTGKNSLSKNPIYLNEEKTETLPEKVTVSILVDDYSIRKEIVGSNPTSKQFVPDYKSIEKVLDTRVRYLLKKRLDDYGGNPQLAFSDLDKNPIWFNEEKQISIKRVKISAVKNAVPLHFKKDHKGNFILDEQGQKIPVDFVSQGNNHHVAIYRDEKGSLQERVVSFFDAVQLTNAGEPVVDKYYRYHEGWRFLFSLKQNEMFIFPDKKGEFNPKEVDLMDPRNKEKISPNLFRVQKIASKDYLFTSHLETKAIDGTFMRDKKELIGISYYRISSPSHLENLVKVRLNHLGDIVSVGEY